MYFHLSKVHFLHCIGVFVICFMRADCDEIDCVGGCHRNFCSPRAQLICKDNEVIDIESARVEYVTWCPPSTSDKRRLCRRIPLVLCHGRTECEIDLVTLFESADCDANRILTLHVKYSCFQFQRPIRMSPTLYEEISGNVVHLLSPNFPCDTPPEPEYYSACQIRPQEVSSGERDKKVRLYAKLIDLPHGDLGDGCPEMLVLRYNDEPVDQLCSGASAINFEIESFRLNNVLEIGYMRKRWDDIAGRFWISLEGDDSNTRMTVTCNHDAEWLSSYPEVPADMDWEEYDWWWWWDWEWDETGSMDNDDGGKRRRRDVRRRRNNRNRNRDGRRRNGWLREHDGWWPDEDIPDITAWSPSDYSRQPEDQFNECTPLPTSETELQEHGSSNGGLLAGVLGGLACLFVIIGVVVLVAFCYKKRRVRHKPEELNRDYAENNHVFSQESSGVTPSAPPYEQTHIYAVAAPIDDHYSTPKHPGKNGKVEIKPGKPSDRYDNVVILKNPAPTYTKVEKERKQKTGLEKNDETNETIMNENDELHEPGEEIEEIRKYTADDVIMHENDDLYVISKITRRDVMKDAEGDDDVIMQENDDVYEGPDEDETKADRPQEHNQKYEDLVRKGDENHDYESLANKERLGNEAVKDNDPVIMYENNELYASSVEDDDHKENVAVVLPKPMSNDPRSRQSFV